MRIGNQLKLVAYLVSNSPDFIEYWKEVSSIYNTTNPIDVPIEDLSVEFARFTLELWQDGKIDALKNVAMTLRLVLNLNGTAESVAKEYIKKMSEDWKENGVNFEKFSELIEQ